MAVPVISTAQMRQWEKASWAAGRIESEVIQSVGVAIAQRVECLASAGQTVLFLAGKGHNGDDVRAAFHQLAPGRHGILVDVLEPVSGLKNFRKALNTSGCSWIVDGLFGIGLNRPLDAAWRKLLKAVNDSAVSVLAVDVPSGLNAATGSVEGSAIKADITLTVGAPKSGLLDAPEYVGRLEVLPEVGLIPCPFESELNWTLQTDFNRLPFRRPVGGNKGTFGHVAIIAGSRGYHGAAVLAAHGALRARPGLVTVYPQESVYVPVASQLQSAMVHPWKPNQTLPKSCTLLLCGPGLADENLPEAVKDEVRQHWQNSPLAMIVDASALDWLQPGRTPRGALRLITPHPGEAGRVLGCSAADVQKDRVAALRALAKRFCNNCVVLKGNQTLVGRQDGPIFINSSGNPFLAQGGSGDLLSGYLAGLLAQPDWQHDFLTTIRYAVWQHGATADHLTSMQSNWTLDELSQQLGSIPAH